MEGVKRYVGFQRNGEVAFYVHGDPGEQELFRPRGSITDKEAGILQKLCAGLHVLEIGTGTGYAAEKMAETAASVTTIDIDPWVQQHIFPVLQEIGIRCESKIPQATFDLVFIDGAHTCEAVLEDYRRAKEIAPKATLVFHDMHLIGVARALKELGLRPTPYGTALGLGVLRP